MHKKFILLWLFIPFLAFAASQDMKKRMLADVDFIKNTFDVYYAPKEWKLHHFGWDLDTEINRAKDKIQATPNITIKQYQTIIKEFFQTTQDYHVNVLFYSTEMAALPFSVRAANGKYFISYIDKERMPENVLLKVGDELISFDRLPTDMAVQELVKTDTPHSNKEADLSFAAYYLTHRAAELGHSVPSGKVVIEIKSKNGNGVRKHELEWDYVPEYLPDAPQPKSLVARGGAQTSTTNVKLKKINKESSLNAPLKRLSRYLEEDRLLGGKKSFIPRLGTKILWKSSEDNPFYAYLYAIDDKKIGYVRISDYSKEKEDFEEFARIISYFQKNSHALIIDQVDNPGGSVDFLYDVLSVVTNKPLALPLEQMMITQEEVENALVALKKIEYAKQDAEFMEMFLRINNIDEDRIPNLINYYNFLFNEWHNGRNFTTPYYDYGIEVLEPSSHHSFYTKPVLVLINGTDMSAGDYFPAILQDNKRATLLGTRTAGAGGTVFNSTFPNKFGIKEMSYTASIAERADKNPIENLGVTPDIEYKITEDDLQNNYRNYVKAINSAVIELLN